MLMTGFCTSGANCTGMALSASAPNINTINTTLMTAMGRSMEALIRFIVVPSETAGA